MYAHVNKYHSHAIELSAKKGINHRANFYLVAFQIQRAKHHEQFWYQINRILYWRVQCESINLSVAHWIIVQSLQSIKYIIVRIQTFCILILGITRECDVLMFFYGPYTSLNRYDRSLTHLWSNYDFSEI